MAVNQEQRAGLAWNVLVEVAKAKRVIRYKELSERIGMSHHRPINYVLDKIYYYCESNELPPLSILVVNSFGVPASGFTDYYSENLEVGFNVVYQTDWHLIGNPFAYALDGTKESDLVDALIDDPNSSEDIFTKVKVRGQVQALFRETLLRIYNHQCAVCNISYLECLEACHIIPWRECKMKDRLHPQNGILLCSNHHKLFDSGWITINESFKVIVSQEEVYSNPNSTVTSLFNNKNIFLPKDKKLQPSMAYLKMHHKKFCD